MYVQALYGASLNYLRRCEDYICMEAFLSLYTINVSSCKLFVTCALNTDSLVWAHPNKAFNTKQLSHQLLYVHSTYTMKH